MRPLRRLCRLVGVAVVALLVLYLVTVLRAPREGKINTDSGIPSRSNSRPTSRTNSRGRTGGVTGKNKDDPHVGLPASEQVPAKCPGHSPCISFGTPYFSDWAGWMPYVRQWLETAQTACGVSCDVVTDPSQADAVMFHARDLHLIPPNLPRSANQHWVYLNMESPLATKKYGYDVSSDPKFRFLFNWTATTMLSSSVHQPYGIWDPRHEPIKGPFYSPEKKHHMAYVAFSNCKSTFNNRSSKVAELQRFMDVHVYGECGTRPLPKEWNVWRKISEEYRYYLSFENAFCRDYITEKYHNNGLDSQAIPVVFGGLERLDYEKVSPPKSFVYALEFKTMRELADHLKALAANEEQYADYFKWKRSLQVSARTALLCGVCTRLHKDRSIGVKDLSEFYSLQRNCRATNYSYLN